ncbi:hypothetical protein Hdeb2414_s0034g00725721 [Helianthus debilis subsp. tardiflorus]
MRALTTISIRNFLDTEQTMLWFRRKRGDNSSSVAFPSNIVMQKQHDGNIYSVAFRSNLLPSFHYLQRLNMMGYDGVEVAVEIESPSNGELAGPAQRVCRVCHRSGPKAFRGPKENIHLLYV